MRSASGAPGRRRPPCCLADPAARQIVARWWCRDCSQSPRWQDAIAYVRQREGVGFAEACQRLGASPSELGMARPQPPRRWPALGCASRPRPASAAPIAKTPAPLPELAGDLEPSAAWRVAGMRFLEDAEAALCSAEGERARAYLHGRGLNDETLRVWRIGFQHEEGRRDPAERWGFSGRTASGQGAWVRIPRGIVIPWLLDDQLWQLKIRTNREQPKYLAIGRSAGPAAARTTRGGPVGPAARWRDRRTTRLPSPALPPAGCFAGGQCSGQWRCHDVAEQAGVLM